MVKLQKFSLVKAILLFLATYFVYLGNYLIDFLCREFIRTRGICFIPNIFLIIIPIALWMLGCWFGVALLNNVAAYLMEKSGKLARENRRKKAEALFK